MSENMSRPGPDADRNHKGHYSDCAVHNGPALPLGPCDCGLEERLKQGDQGPEEKLTLPQVLSDIHSGAEAAAIEVQMITMASNQQMSV